MEQGLQGTEAPAPPRAESARLPDKESQEHEREQKDTTRSSSSE